MTDHVDPSKGSPGNAFMVAQAIRQHGAVGDGWIAETGTSYAADHTDAGVSGTPLNAFDHASTSGHDVTIDTGEAFIGGAWVARDTQTTVSLAASTSDQTVYVGWDAEGGDSVIVGLSGDFTSKDPKVPIWTFDTDGSTVTSSTDERTIGHTADLSDGADLGAGSTLARFLMTAAASSPVGTAGNHNAELFRVPGSTSDAVAAGEHGDGRFSLAYNAYYDGSWKFIAGGVDAYRLSFDGGQVRLQVADGSSAAADDAITWTTLAYTEADNLTLGGTTVYDGSAVPKAVLGGPASSLTSYPLPAGDIDDGDGSGLDADTVDGQEPSQLGGDFAELDSLTDTDDTTVLEYDTDSRFTSFPDHDRYRLQIYKEDRGDGTEHYSDLRLNSDGSTVYDYEFYDSFNNGFQSQGDQKQFSKIAGVRGEVESGVYGAATIVQTIEIARPTAADGALGLPSDAWATISTPVVGGGKNTDYVLQGHYGVAADISRIHLYGGQNATGRVRLLGTDEPA